MSKLRPDHRKILLSFENTSEDFGYRHFATIQAETGMDRKTVRRIVRHLARKGLTVYGRGLWTEDGEPAGSGYAITDAGRRAIEDPPAPTGGQ